MSSRAVLVSVQTPSTSDDACARSLRELEELLTGLGVRVVARLVQRRARPDGVTYLGEGKLRELAALTGGPGPAAGLPKQPSETSALLVVADDELSPGQHHRLELTTSAEVLDRTAVILRVFATRARTREAKLEVELATLRHELPRIREVRSLGDREGGGGRASRGHSNVELAKMRTRDRLASLERELGTVGRSAALRRQGRTGAHRVAIVGYTNAGKSSLLRALTGSEVLIEDRPFATLETTVRPLMPPVTPAILVADTVGFVRRLPHALVASFRSTFAEAAEASLLLHVVDASDPELREHLEVTRRALEEVGAGTAATWVLLNKIDRVAEEVRDALILELPGALPISALRHEDACMLRERIIAFFARELGVAELTIPYHKQHLFAELRPMLQVISERYGERLEVVVRGSAEVMGRLRKRLAEP